MLIFQTTSYVFEDPKNRRPPTSSLQEYGNTYSRIMNPTVAAFEEQWETSRAARGGGDSPVGSPQAAALFTLLEPAITLVSASSPLCTEAR